jgi:predicted DCC family thiol-disulfide oxidoreductase YuxK
MEPTYRAILFFDGDCGLCSRSVRFFMRQDTGEHLCFAPIQGETAAALLDADRRAALSTVVYRRPVPAGGHEVLIRSEAVLRLLIDLRSPWRWVAYPALCIPRGWRDGLYDWVARNRHRFGAKSACALPEPSEHARLLP